VKGGCGVLPGRWVRGQPRAAVLVAGIAPSTGRPPLAVGYPPHGLIHLRDRARYHQRSAMPAMAAGTIAMLI